ncbi:MAG: hypothetical protein JWL70_2780 [Acidimicrobiia bacterium]|nr:hypothetical protein [Acidimicrobiia bacterium]
MTLAIAYSEWRDRLKQAEDPSISYLWAHAPSPDGPLAPGADCSGLAHWAYGPWLDWVYPQTSILYNNADQFGRLHPVDDVQPGWMLIHRPGYKNQPIGHVAMYIGDEGHGPQTIEAHSAHTTPEVGKFPAFAGRNWEKSIAITEINADLDLVAQFAAACRATTIKRGDTGPVVKFLQQELGITQSGVYDAETEATVRAFQHWFKSARRVIGIGADSPFSLPVTGICDPHTWAALALNG